MDIEIERVTLYPIQRLGPEPPQQECLGVVAGRVRDEGSAEHFVGHVYHDHREQRNFVQLAGPAADSPAATRHEIEARCLRALADERDLQARLNAPPQTVTPHWAQPPKSGLDGPQR